jgi:Tfp pilus assembly protein PilZ
MRNLIVAFSRRSELLECYLQDAPGGGVFVATDEDIGLGEVVQTVLVFPEIPEGVPLRGTVIWRRPPVKWRSALRSGVGVAWDEIERSRKEFLLEFCRGHLASVRGRGQRMSVALRVLYSAEKPSSPWCEGRTRDIGRGGMFLLCEDLLIEGEAVALRVYFDQSTRPETVLGRVSWRQLGDDRGMGIAFHRLSGQARHRLEELIARLSRSSSWAPPTLSDGSGRWSGPL